MTDRVFFYGTLMTGFDRRERAGIDERKLAYLGRGFIRAALFDLEVEGFRYTRIKFTAVY